MDHYPCYVPKPLWSEQDPDDWWRATVSTVQAVVQTAKLKPTDVKAIGLSGQMHGATLLDSAHRVLRPAILWNDGRSGAECAELEAREPRTRAITGNAAMAGFTAPKLLWVRKNEPDVFARTTEDMPMCIRWIRPDLRSGPASLPPTMGTIVTCSPCAS